MVSTDPNVITVEGDDDSYQRDSGIANGSVHPGDLIELVGLSSGGATDEKDLSKNAADAANLVPRVALELAKTGKTIDDAYADGDYTEFRTFESGDVAQVRVFDGGNAAGTGTDLSANANISVGDFLVSYGGAGVNGTVRAFDADAEGAKLFQAVEAVDNSAGTEPAFIQAVKL